MVGEERPAGWAWAGCNPKGAGRLAGLLGLTILALAGAVFAAQEGAAEARRLAEARQWSPAEAAFTRLEKAGRLDVEELDLAARASLELNHWDRVIEIYLNFRLHTPLTLERSIRLYEAFLRAGRKGDAEKELRSLLADNPGHQRLTHLMAFLLLEQGRPADAVATYRSLLKANPASYEGHVNLALIFFSRASTGEALDHLSRAFRIDAQATNTFLHRQLVRNMAALSARELARLVDDTRQALGLPPQGLKTDLFLAREYRELNRYGPAIYGFERYLEGNPAQDEVRFDLARLYFLSGDDRKAGSTLSPLLDEPGQQGHQARLFGAELALRSGDFEKASGYLGGLPESYQGLPVYRFLRAQVHLNDGRLERARELLEEVVEEAPEITEALFHLGRLYLRTGQREKGQRLLGEFQKRKAAAR